MICTYVTLQAPVLHIDLSQSAKELKGTSGCLVPAYSGANLEVGPDCSGPLLV